MTELDKFHKPRGFVIVEPRYFVRNIVNLSIDIPSAFASNPTTPLALRSTSMK